MTLSRDDVVHVATLARIALTEDEIAAYQAQLSAILDHFAALQRVDCSGIPPTAQVVALAGVWREDEVEPPLPVETVLANAPRTEDGFIRVRAVLE